MWSTARNIVAGDLVIIWLTRDSVQPLVVTPGKEFNGKFGVYSHADLVGIPFGSKIGSRNGKGFIHVLRPTPELWTIALPHRTQILYLADIAFIVSYLNIKPGSQVVEAGTGSGSFSHAVARTIGSKGHLYTYEFHEARANKAREEFRIHGFSEIITLTHRNVCKDGFTVVDQADSVFLDLPAPWDAIVHAEKALRKDRATRICCFSPCIEQVLRTIAALNDAGFSDITMYETLLRPHEVHTVPNMTPIGEVSKKLKQQETKREHKRRQQIAASQRKKETQPEKKRKRIFRESEGSKEKRGVAEVTGERSPVDTAEPGTETKKLRMGEEEFEEDFSSSLRSINNSGLSVAGITDDSVALPCTTAAGDHSEMAEDAVPVVNSTEREAVIVQEPLSDSPDSLASEPSKMAVSRVINEVRGHTSYLTFAILLPNVIPGKNPFLLRDSAENKEEDASAVAV
ncbi:TRM61 [Sanghuangporus vaninii]